MLSGAHACMRKVAGEDLRWAAVMCRSILVEAIAHVPREASQIDAHMLVLGLGCVEVRNQVHRTARR